MQVLRLTHTTEYRYARPVTFGEHRLMFRPRGSHDLRLLDTRLEISPTASVRWYHDVFGNSIAIAAFAASADTLRIVSGMRLEHYAVALPEFPLEPYARRYPFRYSTQEWPDLAWTTMRNVDDPGQVVDRWARRFVHAGSADTQQLLVSMTEAIHREIVYRRRAEHGTQSPVETLTAGSGSCRDLALLMMEAARSLGLAARFASGYRCDEQEVLAAGGTLSGGETHAWTEIYLPGAGWVEFDPSTGAIGGRNLLRVAVAREPGQAVPLAGTFYGRADDFLSMAVDVTITLEPAG